MQVAGCRLQVAGLQLAVLPEGLPVVGHIVYSVPDEPAQSLGQLPVLGGVEGPQTLPQQEHELCEIRG